MRTLTATFTYMVNGYKEEKEFTCELDGSENEESIREQIAEQEEEQAQDQRGEDEQGQEYTKEMIELTDVTIDEGDADEYESLEKIFDFASAYCECDQDIEVVVAALKCDIQGSDIDEAYNGTASSDEDFVENLCNDIGDLPKDLPSYIVIDWEATARNVMMDYCEHNGHYFRRF